MALRFKKATAVAIGTFNIYVIQPKWLREVRLLAAEPALVRMESDLVRPGFRYIFPGQEIKWDVRPDSLILDSQSPGEDCGGLLAQVLEKLPWTPLLGVGSNVEFHGDLAELASTSIAMPSCDEPTGYVVKQKSAHIAIERAAQIFNFQLSATDQLVLSINIHTELRNKGSQEEICEMATAASRSFFELREEAVGLAKHLFNFDLELSNV